MSRPRFDYFQTDSEVAVSIMKRNVELSSCRVTFKGNYITVYVNEEVVFDGQLGGIVDESNLTVKCTPSKIEIKLPKKEFGHWPSLFSSEVKADPPKVVFAKKDWDAIEKEVLEEEDNEELEGDAAVNRMFRKIYENASDDVKKAMIKSYSESGGTVLSTNWDEISKKKTDVKPPDCMEYKKFE